MTPARPDTVHCTTPSASAAFDGHTISPYVYQHQSIYLTRPMATSYQARTARDRIHRQRARRDGHAGRSTGDMVRPTWGKLPGPPTQQETTAALARRWQQVRLLKGYCAEMTTSAWGDLPTARLYVGAVCKRQASQQRIAQVHSRPDAAWYDRSHGTGARPLHTRPSLFPPERSPGHPAGYRVVPSRRRSPASRSTNVPPGRRGGSMGGGLQVAQHRGLERAGPDDAARHADPHQRAAPRLQRRRALPRGRLR